MITLPIYNLLKGTKKVAAGDLSLEVDKTSNDEIGELTESFNSMIKNLKDSEERLSFDAEHDSLTQLPNRKMFMANLERAFRRFKRDPKKIVRGFVY